MAKAIRVGQTMKRPGIFLYVEDQSAVVDYRPVRFTALLLDCVGVAFRTEDGKLLTVRVEQKE